jgi:hypothetical protein
MTAVYLWNITNPAQVRAARDAGWREEAQAGQPSFAPPVQPRCSPAAFNG